MTYMNKLKYEEFINNTNQFQKAAVTNFDKIRLW